MDFLKICLFIGLCHLSEAVHCDQERYYHKNYGYGSEIICAGIKKDTERMLRSISAYNEIILRITNSNLDLGAKLLENLAKIRFLFISNSTIKYQDAPIKNLHLLEHLVMENVNFFNASGDLFGGVDNLRELVMKNCSLRNITSGFFKKIVSLEKLTLSDNKIFRISVCTLKRLKFLHLDKNDIDFLDNNTFECAQGVKNYLLELDLSYNKLKTIEGLEKLSNLKILNLEGNNLDGISQKAFRSLEHLEKINLKGNKIQNFEVSNQTSLKRIHLDNNQLKKIKFNNLTNLEEIYVSNNEINLENFKLLPKLRVLSLDGNKIDNLSSQFLNFSNLEILDISSNRIVLHYKIFQNLVSLKHLYMKNNSIEKIPNRTFKNMTNLTILDISQNLLTNISNPQLFSDLKQLRILNLSSNFLENLNIEIFRPLHNLQILDVASNKLHQFEINVISFLPMIRVVNIKSNLLSCDTLLGIIEFLKNRNISFNINENFQYDRENIAGIYCRETVNERRVSGYDDLPKIGAFAISGILFVAISIVFLAFVVVHKFLHFSRRRKYNIDEIELI